MHILITINVFTEKMPYSKCQILHQDIFQIHQQYNLNFIVRLLFVVVPSIMYVLVWF